MKLPRKPVALAIALVFVSAFFTLYALRAHAVAAAHIYEDEKADLSTGEVDPPALFFLGRKSLACWKS